LTSFIRAKVDMVSIAGLWAHTWHRSEAQRQHHAEIASADPSISDLSSRITISFWQILCEHTVLGDSVLNKGRQISVHTDWYAGQAAQYCHGHHSSRSQPST